MLHLLFALDLLMGLEKGPSDALCQGRTDIIARYQLYEHF